MKVKSKIITLCKPSHNKRYTLRWLFATSGLRKTAVGLFALGAVLSTPHLGQGTFATQSSITCPNRQLPRTLCESLQNNKTRLSTVDKSIILDIS